MDRDGEAMHFSAFRYEDRFRLRLKVEKGATVPQTAGGKQNTVGPTSSAKLIVPRFCRTANCQERHTHR
jgi:hypothetical protein